jgi:hypothetical protein
MVRAMFRLRECLLLILPKAAVGGQLQSQDEDRRCAGDEMPRIRHLIPFWSSIDASIGLGMRARL